MVSSFDVYQTYLALKFHFNKKEYDYFKYHGRVRPNEGSFKLRRDRIFFEKLAKKFNRVDELVNYLIANMTEDRKFWIRDLVGVKAEARYTKWKKKQESLSYLFKENVSRVADSWDGTFDELFECSEGQHPPLFTMYARGEVDAETLIGIDSVLNCFEKWDREIDDELVWGDAYFYLCKYRPFLKIDSDKFKKILQEEFVTND